MKALCFPITLFLLTATLLHAQRPEDEPVVKAVKKNLPKVVNIFTTNYQTRQIIDPYDLFFDQFFGGGSVRGNRIVQIPTRSLGSGLLVSAEGYIVTNQHVVERASEQTEIKVTLHDGSQHEATFIRDDPDQDLALIKISSESKLPFLSLQNLSPNLHGQTVIAIGNPVGYESSVSKGILSATDRSISVGNTSFEGLLQTDAAINPGNSGGPLIDISGNLVGINSAKMGMGADNVTIENIGFAIPADRVKTFVEDSIAIAKGIKPEPPKKSLSQTFKKHFGLEFQDLTPELASQFGFTPYEGFLVTSVSPESPAQKAGFESGMIIVALNNTRTRQIDKAPRHLFKIKKGQKVKFTVRFNITRGNYFAQKTDSVILEAR